MAEPWAAVPEVVAGLKVSARDWETECEAESVTCRLKLNVPDTVGVPVRLELIKLNPAGSVEPEARLQV
jgi:hypothetical protein